MKYLPLLLLLAGMAQANPRTLVSTDYSCWGDSEDRVFNCDDGHKRYQDGQRVDPPAPTLKQFKSLEKRVKIIEEENEGPLKSTIEMLNCTCNNPKDSEKLLCECYGRRIK